MLLVQPLVASSMGVFGRVWGNLWHGHACADELGKWGKRYGDHRALSEHLLHA